MHQIQHVPRIEKPEKESIHSGQFMVSHFEAEEQDDEDNVAVPIPEVTGDLKSVVPVKRISGMLEYVKNEYNQQQLSIDTSLSKLFQCMSLAYRQKLTSPKWNRFRGIRLRWKDKIRLNNVIWRCWHMQFIKKENTLICQFASPLDVDTHNKPEAVVLEGKYWKRKLAAVTAEYKKWRMFYRNHALGHAAKDSSDMLNDMELLTWDSNSSDNMMMMVDEDYMGLMSDTLFSTITNQPFAFPDSREIARAGLADFIQPSLGPLQPNLDDYMDTIDPLHDFMTNKLPPVPEEQHENLYKQSNWGYIGNDSEVNTISPPMVEYQQLQPLQPLSMDKQTVPIQDTRQTTTQSVTGYDNMLLETPIDQFVSQQQQIEQPPYHSSVISKTKPLKNVTRGKLEQQQIYSKSVDSVYQCYQQSMAQQSALVINDRIVSISNSIVPQQQQPQQQLYKMTATPEPPHQTTTTQESHQQQQQFKVPANAQDTRQGYKFSAPSSNPNIKFTSQNTDKIEPRRRGAPRGRQRSRSNTREPIKRPPLISAVSDPQLITPTNSVLLTQLLATRDTSNHVFNRSHSTGSAQDMASQVRIKEEKSNTPIPILAQPQSHTLIIQGTLNSVQPLSADPLALNTFSNSNSPVMDATTSQNLNSPTSSQGSIGSPNRDTSQHHRDRRVGHIHAEQKRRYNIKNGFDMLHSLIPHLNQNPNSKLSKAAMLQKGAEYIRQLRSERNQLKEEMDSLRQQIESLNASISNCQSMLPATGAPVSRRRDSKMQEMFDEHVRTRTMENWKYWIFSLIFRPLLNTFNNIVSTSSLDDLYTSTMIWVEQHCSLVDLRPVVLNSLTNLCTITDVLSDPDKLPEEARQMVQKKQQQQQNNQQLAQ
ncbi:MLX-interacting protein isoform X2 [Aethina tumida]|uniref:MLX-interacting protein isoform X2 n=1 Tax=Aethina tumida TaxID=116153 RepID=UPI0021484BD0|nr:MLX-interacting protein isoform X2 [Aethina tumida]